MRRLMALMLAIAMLLSVTPLAVFAADTVVAKIGNTEYTDLQAALDAGGVVELLKNVDISSKLYINKDVIIDGNGYTITATGTNRLFRINDSAKTGKAANVEFTDIIIKNNTANSRCIETRSGDLSLTLNGVELYSTGPAYDQTLTVGGSGNNITVNIVNSVIEADTHYGIVTFNPVNMTITNSEITGFAALYMKGVDGSLGSAGSKVSVIGSTLKGVNNAAYDPSNSFGAVVLEDSNISISLTNGSSIVAAGNGNNVQYGLATRSGATNIKVDADKTSAVKSEITGGKLVAGDIAVAVAPGNPFMSVGADGSVSRRNYVSLGDSMTNGLGHDGYVDSGYEEYVATAYPMMFAERYGFNLKQLATSAARAEDYHYILEVGMPNAYEGDQWTQTEMLGKDTKGINGEDLWGCDRWGSNGVPDAAVVENFRKSVTEADVITLAVGNGNFGVTLMDMTSQIMGLGGYNLNYSYATLENALTLNGVDPQITSVVMDTYNRALEYAKQYLPIDKVDVLADRVAYTVASFLINYEGLLDRIIEMNPDVEVIIVSLVNNMYGFKLDIVQDETTTTLDMAQFMDYILGPVNAYLAGLAAYKQVSGAYPEATLYYAEAYEIATWAQSFDEMYTSDPEQRAWCHSRFVPDIRGFIFPMLNQAGLGLVEITDADVLAYEAAYAAGPVDFATYAMLNSAKAKSIAVYLGLVDAILTALNSTPAVDLSELSVGGGDFATMAAPLLDDVFEKFEQNVTDKAAALEIPPALLSMATPEQLAELIPLFVTTESLADALESNGTIMALLNIYGRTKLANGLSSHPSVAGHITMFNAIVNAYENGYTAKDETYANIVDAMQFAYTYVVENYNEIYNNAWNLAKAQGFVDMANGYIDQVVAIINSIDYSALADKTHLIPTLDALKAEVLGDVAALRALINNPNHPTAGEITALMNELNNDLTALQNVAAQADIDAVAQLITLHAQILKQYDIAYNEACRILSEQLGQAYDMLVAEIVRIAAEQDAAAAEKLAQYLGQNPADLIDTILKYGADAQAFINYWSYYAEMLLGPAWNEYGEDITAFVQENIAKLMASLKAEAEALGNEAADALMAYIADLKIAENVTAIAEQLKNGSLELGQDTLAELEGIVNSLNGQLIDNANEVILALEALAECEDAAAAKAIIEAAIAEIRKTEADRMAALDAIYADIMAAKATVDEATAAVLELQDAALVLANLLENPLSFNFDNTMNAVTTLLDELNDAVITVQAAVNEIVTLTNDVTATAQKIYNEALASKDQINAALAQINSTLQNAGSDAQILAGNAYTAAEAYVLGTLGKVEADARDLLALCNTELQNAVNSVIATVNTYLFNATHGDYEIDRFSKYVALGEKEAYADELATLLGMADRYVKMSLTEDYLSQVAGADLVTVKFDNGEFLTFAYNQVMGMAAELINGNASLINLMKNPYYGATVKEYVTAYVDLNAKAEELDWNAYLDARAQGVLRETLANVKTLMLEDGVPEVYAFDIGAILTEMLNEGSEEDIVVINLVLDIPVADLALAAIENVLYGYVRFAYEFQAVVNEIHAVSPDAEVVISGIENPAIGMVLEIEDIQVNVGEYAEYVQYVVDALNLHLYAYALATDNTTYVESNTATDIRNALNVTYKGLMGDVNNDGAVTLVDAILVLDYSNGVIGAEGLTLGMADVDGDGEVKLVDAILILDFSNGVLEYFPAELQ